MTKPVAALTLALTLLLGGDRARQPSRPQTVSSYTLISRALAAGQINAETAHKYRVFAAFGDRRLPPSFRGDDAGITELPSSVLNVERLMSTFSKQTQAELAPFFLPPGDPASWIHLSTVAGEAQSDPPEDGAFEETSQGPSAAVETSHLSAIQWDTFSAVGGKVKIWAQTRRPDDVAKARALAADMTAKIWPTLVGLFWEPLSDINSPRNSGGPALDVFLVRPGFTDRDAAYNRATYGDNLPFSGRAMYADPMKCKEAAFFLLLNSRRPLGSETSEGLRQDLAHELTHAITGRKPLKGDCAEYTWATEATATWAEHFVYPRANPEHYWASEFMKTLENPLDDNSSGEVASHAYESYVFPFYLQLKGQQQAIPAMWEKFRDFDLLAGVNEGLKVAGTTLMETFPLFAVRNLNQASVDDYKQKDQLKDSVETREFHEVSLQAATPVSFEKKIPLGIPYLAAKYAHFKFDESVRTVTFDNPLVPLPHASVWIVPKILASWEAPIEMTKQGAKTWCRDVPREDLDELIIVFTNNEWQNKNRTVETRPDLPTVTAHRTGCGGWVGTYDQENTMVSRDPNITIVETVRTNIQFALNDSLNLAGQPREYWKAVAGTIEWQVQVRGSCTGSDRGSVSIPHLPAEPAATLRIWEEDGKLHHMGANGPWPGDIPRFIARCSNGTTTELGLQSALGWFVTDGDKDEMAPDGKSFAGDFLGGFPPQIVVHHKYAFRCTRRC